jgi:SAM-dependent methyltransferase
MARENRSYLRRAVRFLAGQGIQQFLDLGCGLPSVGNVHEIAYRVAPHARVVYVDIDPIAAAHNERMLAGVPTAAVIQADLRRPDAILDDPTVRGMLDLRQPVAVLLVSVLHFVADEDDPWAIVGHLRDRVAAGSYLVASHATPEGQPDDMARLEELTRDAGITATARSREQILDLFAGWDLVRPGLVWTAAWRPEEPASLRGRAGRAGMLAGVAGKPVTGVRAGRGRG